MVACVASKDNKGLQGEENERAKEVPFSTLLLLTFLTSSQFSRGRKPRIGSSYGSRFFSGGGGMGEDEMD